MFYVVDGTNLIIVALEARGVHVQERLGMAGLAMDAISRVHLVYV